MFSNAPDSNVPKMTSNLPKHWSNKEKRSWEATATNPSLWRGVGSEQVAPEAGGARRAGHRKMESGSMAPCSAAIPAILAVVLLS